MTKAAHAPVPRGTRIRDLRDVPGTQARETLSAKYQRRSHRCRAIRLKAIEQHITAEQNDSQQAVHKIRRQSRPLIAHRSVYQC
jgi:hypothetical protein